MAQGGKGRVELFEDFFGAEIPVANTEAETEGLKIGSLKVTGADLNETDCGVVEQAMLGGVVRLTTTDTDGSAVAIGTAVMFDVALMGTLILEARVQMSALAARGVYVGFTDENDDAESEQVAYSAATTVTLSKSDLAGFFMSSEYTATAEWHYVYNGGTTTGETDTAELVTGVVAVAGEWDILRVEVDPNGTARWYVNGVLKATKAGAVSTTVDLAAVVQVGASTTTVATLDVDYFMVKANRDWTR